MRSFVLFSLYLQQIEINDDCNDIFNNKTYIK